MEKFRGGGYEKFWKNLGGNRKVVQITTRFGVQLIRNCTETTIALNPVICTLGTIAMSI